MVTAGIGGAYLDTTHGLATELKLLPPASRNWRDGDNDATFVQQPACYPSVEDSRAWVKRLGQPWRPEWIVRRNPGVFTALAVTHFTIFLLMLLIFWQGIQAKENGLIIDAYLSASPAELFRFAGGLLAVVLLGFALCLLPMVRGRPPLVSVKVMVFVLCQLGTACATPNSSTTPATPSRPSTPTSIKPPRPSSAATAPAANDDTSCGPPCATASPSPPGDR